MKSHQGRRKWIDHVEKKNNNNEKYCGKMFSFKTPLMCANLFKCHDVSRAEYRLCCCCHSCCASNRRRIYFTMFNQHWQTNWKRWFTGISSKIVSVHIKDKQKHEHFFFALVGVKCKASYRLLEWRNRNKACFVVFRRKINEPALTWYQELCYNISNIWFDVSWRLCLFSLLECDIMYHLC